LNVATGAEASEESFQTAAGFIEAALTGGDLVEMEAKLAETVQAGQVSAAQQASVAEAVAALDATKADAKEARNRPNIDWRDKIHRRILRGLRNISETP
jgi:hypothetical protein